MARGGDFSEEDFLRDLEEFEDEVNQEEVLKQAMLKEEDGQGGAFGTQSSAMLFQDYESRDFVEQEKEKLVSSELYRTVNLYLESDLSHPKATGSLASPEGLPAKNLFEVVVDCNKLITQINAQ